MRSPRASILIGLCFGCAPAASPESDDAADVTASDAMDSDPTIDVDGGESGSDAVDDTSRADVEDHGGCRDWVGPGLPRDGFVRARPWEEAIFSDIDSPSSPRFWELRVFYDEAYSDVVVASGAPCPGEGPSCLEAYEEAVESARGFQCHWLVGPVPANLIVADRDGFKSFDSHDSLLSFFGSIDTPFEARIWAWTHCESPGFLREVETGYEAIVYTLDEVCCPIVSSERNMYFDSDGGIRRGSEHAVTSVECGSCI